MSFIEKLDELGFKFDEWYFDNTGDLPPEWMGKGRTKRHQKKIQAWNDKYNTTDNGRYPNRRLDGASIVAFEQYVCNFDEKAWQKRTDELVDMWRKRDDPVERMHITGESEAAYEKRMMDLDGFEEMSEQEFERLITHPGKKWEQRNPGLVNRYLALNPNREKDYTKNW